MKNKDNIIKMRVRIDGLWHDIYNLDDVRNIQNITEMYITEKITLEEAKEIYPEIFNK